MTQTHQRDFAAETSSMFQIMRDKMDRDPEKTKQYWRFVWFIHDQLEQDQLESNSKKFNDEIGDRFELWLSPKEEILVDVLAEGEFVTRFEYTIRRVMNESELVAAHRQFEAMGKKAGLEYEGCTFFLKDRRQDAAELFLYSKAFEGRDLEAQPSNWLFTFQGICKAPETVTQLLGSTLQGETNLTEEQLEAEYTIGEVGRKQAAIIKLRCFTKFTQLQLETLSQKLAKSAKKSRINYLGAEVESTRPDASNTKVEDPDSESSQANKMSIGEGVQWINQVLKVSSRFNIDSIANAAPKMRQFHLKQLNNVGMVAADWMPTADQRLENKLRPKKEIVRKLMASFVSTAWVCAPPEMVTNEQIKKYLSTNGLGKSAFSAKEMQWMQSKRAELAQFAPQAGWITENLWSFSWLLGFSPTPNISGQMVGDEILLPIREKLLLGLDRTFEDLMAKTKLRRLESVIALEDLMYCAHNAVRVQDITHGGLMHERRQPLTWALSPGVRWDDTDVST